MTNDQWKDLLYAIHKGKCMLLLGAGASTLTKNGITRPLTEWLSLELATQLRNNHYPLEESESGSLLYVATEYLLHFQSAIKLQSEVERFYREQAKQPNELLRAIAKLPFPLIINTAPDTLLEKAWMGEFKEYHKTFYSLLKERSREEADLQIEDPTGDCPLLYNLFGSVEDSASLVLTEKDRLKFIEDIIQHNNAIPNAILKEFREDKVVLFFGFDFEQWHLRILPKKIFQKEEISAPVIVPNGGQTLSKGAMVFYQKQYKMDFLPEDPLAFVQELSRRWENYEAEAGQETQQAPVRAVFLYDREDEPWKVMLDKHFAVLKRAEGIHTWDESMIGAGEETGEQIRQQLDQANLILLLVSSDFLASDKLYNEQLRQALQRSGEGKAYIIPILVRPCAWEGAVFAKSKFILPRKQNPIAAWDDKDAACRSIVLELEKYLPIIVENLQA
ncbi:MAG TPA: toll/interleukin-1 receptor domain-containing protein [Saprospiraceae bacterium]|nr:toll/interleukin-1 receptor domain-containing protein [Saprospiraceae bacterium]HPI06776.1 toll/interleukin-1 receptor domain-containing protein [Saprospiraceae bacterium]